MPSIRCWHPCPCSRRRSPGCGRSCPAAPRRSPPAPCPGSCRLRPEERLVGQDAQVPGRHPRLLGSRRHAVERGPLVLSRRHPLQRPGRADVPGVSHALHPEHAAVGDFVLRDQHRRSARHGDARAAGHGVEGGGEHLDATVVIGHHTDAGHRVGIAAHSDGPGRASGMRWDG